MLMCAWHIMLYALLLMQVLMCNPIYKGSTC